MPKVGRGPLLVFSCSDEADVVEKLIFYKGYAAGPFTTRHDGIVDDSTGRLMTGSGSLSDSETN